MKFDLRFSNHYASYRQDALKNEKISYVIRVSIWVSYLSVDNPFYNPIAYSYNRFLYSSKSELSIYDQFVDKSWKIPLFFNKYDIILFYVSKVFWPVYISWNNGWILMSNVKPDRPKYLWKIEQYNIIFIKTKVFFMICLQIDHKLIIHF